MTAAIIPIAPKSAEDAAWDAYQQHKAKELAEPRLATDRAHMEQSTRLHEAWRRLFLANERSADVVPIDGGRK
jgi:hypothetical protein